MSFFRAVIYLLIRSKIYQYIAYQRRQGCALLSYALRLRIKEWRHDGDGSCEGGIPKTPSSST